MIPPNPSERLWSFYKKRISGEPVNARLRNEIAVKHIGLAREAAHRMEDQCAEPYEDLEQIAFCGLVKAVERFNPTRGVSFSSFAMPYLRGEILHFLRDHGTGVKIPRRWRESNSSANRVERSWANQFGRLPTEHELAAELNCKVERVREVRGAIANQKSLPLDEEHLEIPEPLAFTERQENSSRLEAAWNLLRSRLSDLPSDERDILESVYFEHQSRKAIALRLHIEPSLVKSKLAHALDYLGKAQ